MILIFERQFKDGSTSTRVIPGVHNIFTAFDRFCWRVGERTTAFGLEVSHLEENYSHVVAVCSLAESAVFGISDLLKWIVLDNEFVADLSDEEIHELMEFRRRAARETAASPAAHSGDGS